MVCSMVSLKHWLYFIYSAWLCVFDTLCIAVEVVVCIGVCMLFLMWYGGSCSGIAAKSQLLCTRAIGEIFLPSVLGSHKTVQSCKQFCN